MNYQNFKAETTFTFLMLKLIQEVLISGKVIYSKYELHNLFFKCIKKTF